MKVFFDTDVIISSLLSKSGAASFLVNKDLGFTKFISNISTKEVRSVVMRKNIDKESTERIIRNFNVTKITKEIDQIDKDYIKYVKDIDDSHIIAGADISSVKYLLTYNLKHYLIEDIKKDLDIIVMNPGVFLQYLRSLN